MALVTLNSFSTATTVLNGGDQFYLSPTATIASISNAVTFNPVSASSVVIGIYGTIFANGTGISVNNAFQANLIIGAQGSVISDNQPAVSLTGELIYVVNNGTLSTIDNSSGLSIQMRAGATFLYSEITNTGTITGPFGISIFSAEGTVKISNSGRITGQNSGIQIFNNNPLELYLTNTGVITSNADSGAAVKAPFRGFIHNSGTILAPLAVGIDVGGTLKLKNAGTISGVDNAIVAGGTTDLQNEGLILGAIQTNTGDDLITNSGRISGGIETEGGADFVRNSGTVGSDIELGDGNDTYIGLNGQVILGVSGDGGNDLLKGGSEDDTFRGGTGNDDLRGGGGDDDLHGDDGNDTVAGGSGDDQIFGDKGRDSLRGGSGADDFIYLLKTDSTGKFFDTIADFQRGEDHIDLTAVGGKKFIGTSGFGGTAGEVRFKTIGTDAMVFVDLTGNKKPDMKILLDDIAQLSADDFLF